MKYLLEVCVDSVESAINAAAGGADRLELCSGLAIGGLTPGVSLYRQVREACGLPVHVLLRPRFGDFCYTDREFDQILRDVELFRGLGADGAVIGILRPDGSLDQERMRLLMEAAAGMKVTLHRAFDMCRDPFAALETAVELGIDTVLTSGQKNSCMEGEELLAELVKKSRDRICILAAGGVDEAAVAELSAKAGITRFHMSGKVIRNSGMLYRTDGVHMGLPGLSEYEVLLTDARKVRAAKQALMRAEDFSVSAVMRYYYRAMPAEDRANYPETVWEAYARHAVFLMEQGPFRKEVPAELFLPYVAYYRINEEEIEDCRRFFYEQVIERIRGLDMEQAILEINLWCSGQASYRASDTRTASPLAVYRSGLGRCGEESVFLASVLRSVGIPARQVYVPRWSHCDDNHAWVEAWCGGKWHYLGACEPEPVLDRGWFSSAASRAMMVHYRWFSPDPPDGEVCKTEGSVRLINRLPHYASAVEAVVQVMDGDRPAAGAKVLFQILNESAFYTAASAAADENGIARMKLGRGNIHVHAVLDGRCAWADLNLSQSTELTLRLDQDAPIGRWEEFECAAPLGISTPPDSESGSGQPGWEVKYAAEQKHWQDKMARYRQDARIDRIASFCIHKDSITAILKEAYGNLEELMAFLLPAGVQKEQELKENMLFCLSSKDYRDVKAKILNAHFEELKDKETEYSRQINAGYLVNPRVHTETLTAYRRKIEDFYNDGDRGRINIPAQRFTPELLWNDICSRIADPAGSGYQNLITLPAACLRTGQGNDLSRRILFVAACRTFGIPARLAETDLQPEYYEGGSFHRMKDSKKTSCLTLHNVSGTEWVSPSNWSLSRLESGEYIPLNLSGSQWEHDRLSLPLMPGRYCLITANRLPNGSIRAARQEILLADGENGTVKLHWPHADLKDLLTSLPLPPVPLAALREPAASAALPGLSEALWIWLEEGKEPTEHVLNELAACAGRINRSDICIRLLIGSPGAADNPSVCRVLEMIPKSGLYLCDFSKYAEPVCRSLYMEPGRLPMLYAQAGPNTVYAVSGYRVGSVETALSCIKEALKESAL